MQDLPHHYHVTAEAGRESLVTVSTVGPAALSSGPPAEFGGTGDQWSPETLLTASLADCFILTFRAVASASNFPWNSLHCEVDSKLDRVERVTHFTRFFINATLTLPADGDRDTALRLLEKAEYNCLVSNSLNANVTLNASVETAG